MAQQFPGNWGALQQPGPRTAFDIYERTQLALMELQILFSVGELDKQELINATKLVMSPDKENLVVAEEIIKSKLG